MNKRPLAVTVVGWLYIVVGIGGLASHAGEFKMGDLFEADVIEAVAVQFTAIVAGSFLLRGENWARWLAVAWIVFHVVLSALHAWSQFAVHLLIAAGITYLLFRRDAARYFEAKATN